LAYNKLQLLQGNFMLFAICFLPKFDEIDPQASLEGSLA